MKLSVFYNYAIKSGIECDPRRNKSRIKSYADSGILYGSPDKEVKRILAGIDIEVAELLLADNIRRQEGLDLVLSHHPEGWYYANLHEVMQLQVDLLRQVGVREEVAQELLEERKREVQRRILPQNHTRPVDAARLLGMPFMCLHTPADNHAFWFIKCLIEKKKPATIKDIVSMLQEIPEYQQAEKNGVGPRIILGNPLKPVGKILIEMTGGTEGPRDVFDKLYNVGVRTLVSMHLSEEHFKKVKDANLNVVIAGHISSDTLGLNLLLDKIEKKTKENLEIICCSGFNRVKR